MGREPFFRLPVSSPDLTARIRSDRFGKGYFGASRNRRRTHQGVDFIGVLNSPVLAAKSGRVIRSAEEAGYGKHIYLLHPDGLTTRYAHLAFLNVKEGDWVKQGQLIGGCGKSGNAGNLRMITHLHFEIRKDAIPLDPTRHGLFSPSVKIYR